MEDIQDDIVKAILVNCFTIQAIFVHFITTFEYFLNKTTSIDGLIQIHSLSNVRIKSHTYEHNTHSSKVNWKIMLDHWHGQWPIIQDDSTVNFAYKLPMDKIE